MYLLPTGVKGFVFTGRLKVRRSRACLANTRKLQKKKKEREEVEETAEFHTETVFSAVCAETGRRTILVWLWARCSFTVLWSGAAANVALCSSGPASWSLFWCMMGNYSSNKPSEEPRSSRIIRMDQLVESNHQNLPVRRVLWFYNYPSLLFNWFSACLMKPLVCFSYRESERFRLPSSPVVRAVYPERCQSRHLTTFLRRSPEGTGRHKSLVRTCCCL